MKILMISSTFPYPPSRGGTEIRTFNLLKYLNRRHEVTLVTQRHKGVSDSDVEELRKWASNLVIFPLADKIETENSIDRIAGKVGRFIESLIKMTPANVLYRYSEAMQEWIDEFVKEGKCDAIACEHSVSEIYIRPQFRQQVQTIINIHSSVSGWIRNHLEMGASPNPLRDHLYLALILEKYEKRYSSKFNYLVVTTEDDKNQFLKLNPEAKIEVIPNGVDLDLFPYRRKDPGGEEIVFVGAMDASHNIDAARFFALEVLPVIQKRYTSATFRIVGARPTKTVLELAKRPGVSVTGEVAAIAPELHRATVCVIPLRVGYGIKNKTLEAMAAGVPVVGSNRGLEGIKIETSEGLAALRANQLPEYVEALTSLFENPELRQQLSKNGRLLVEKEYTWEQIGKRYEKLLLRAK